MRIRRAASRLLGSAYSSAAQAADAEPPPAASGILPPPPPVGACTAVHVAGLGGPAVAPEGVCELSLSPWDLPCELDESSDPQNMQQEVQAEAPFDKYFVHIPRWPSFEFSSKEDDTMGLNDKIREHDDVKVVSDQKPADDNSKKDGVAAKTTTTAAATRKGKEDRTVLQAEESEDKKPDIFFCKKNDGRKWRCRSVVDEPNTLCDYHLARSRSCCITPSCHDAVSSYHLVAAPAASSKASAIGKAALAKPSCRSRPTTAGAASSSKAVAPGKSKAATSSTRPTSQRRKRKSTNGNGNGNGSCGDYYFYDLFGPFRGKDRRNSSSHRPASAGAEDEEHLQQQQHNNLDGDNLSNESSITGGDKENDGDYVVRGGGAGNGKGKGKMSAVEKVQFPKITKKRIKERSLKSLL
ncbi:uncharacterized protein LOC102713523 [Oryza brachyantha]|uniref:uncharacterized protein LOC102713523 n=1 Tax=Oryza brachyantha TaxID=4533 RepID=UPI0003EAB03F|nr:uncharacterized protein LOC102713523 [Oryza brachyantha]